MIGEKTVLASAEIDYALRFVDFAERLYVPVTIRNLLDQLAIGGVVIDVRPATAVAEP